MVAPRTILVAAVLLGLFYTSFDSGWLGGEPPPTGISGALCVFALLFGFGAWATNRTGDLERSQMFAGVAVAAAAYGLGRLVLG